MIDFNLDYKYPVKFDEVDLILQQLDILFDTVHGEVLGEIGYGTNYSEFLYNLQMSNDDIRDRVMEDIKTIQTFGYSYDVNVTILMGTENDIVLIQITFSKGNRSFTKDLKILK